MKQHQWQKIDKILNEALSFRSFTKQEAYIREQYSHQQALMEDALRILNAIHEADEQGFLE